MHQGATGGIDHALNNSAELPADLTINDDEEER